jgi:hypothetical protein
VYVNAQVPGLAGDLPYVLFNETLNIANICGGGSGSGSGGGGSGSTGGSTSGSGNTLTMHRKFLSPINATAIQAEVALKTGKSFDASSFKATKPSKKFVHRGQASKMSKIRPDAGGDLFQVVNETCKATCSKLQHCNDTGGPGWLMQPE